jgi:phosphoribosylformimino-5-aminoimidazole carboxamide ribotide isomerase
MDVIPAIDILDGRCVRLYQGDYEQSEVYGEDPLAIAQHWYSQGAKVLHVVDLDGARAGKPQNLQIIEAIARSIPIHVQVGGGLRDRNSIMAVLATGVSRVILGTIAVEQPQLVADICAEFPGQILVGIDARDGKVATRGWLNTSEIQATELAQRVTGVGVSGIVYTDIQRDGTLEGANIAALKTMLATVSVPVYASGGISSITDLLELLTLETQGLAGAILGRSLYTGHIHLPEAFRAVGQGRWQNVPTDTAVV